jgi:hypothetical protein
MKRLGAIDIAELLAHPAFAGVDFDSAFTDAPDLPKRVYMLSKQKQNESKYLPSRIAEGPMSMLSSPMNSANSSSSLSDMRSAR